MAFVWVLMWILTAVAAYFMTEAACLFCGRQKWDKSTREFAAVCSILFGPVYFVISAELLLLAAVGRGLKNSHHRISRD